MAITRSRYGALCDGDVEPTTEEAYELADAWREASDQPGFMQPPAHLVRAVEDEIGEPVWESA